MKKLLVIVAMAALMPVCSFGQITKADIESMLEETGVSLATLDRVYLANSLVFYSDGTSQRLEVYYDRLPNDGVNVFSLAESGFKIGFLAEGKNTVVHFYPYDNVASFDIFPDYIRFTFKH